MKTASFICPAQHFIDTAPLAASYAVLAQAVLSFIAARQFGQMLRASRTIEQLVRMFTRLERHNYLLGLKLEMLSQKPWRERVLAQLGGMGKLKLWEAAHKRMTARIKRKAAAPAVQEPAWLYTPARIAESERLKAWARQCAKAAANPLIFRDRCAMDFDGLFRLAPLPRGARAAPRLKFYTQATISDYDYNATAFRKVEGFGPAPIWPAEFYAAMEAEEQISKARKRKARPCSKDALSKLLNSKPDKRAGPRLLPLDALLDDTSYYYLL